MGQVQIGDCTLYQGDCLEIMPTLGKVDAVVTDPPYKVTSGGFGNLEGGFSGWIKDAYDNKGSIVSCDLDWIDWLPAVFKICADKAHCYVFTNDRNLPQAWDAAEKSGFVFHRLLTWNKKTALPNRWYIQNCEFVLFMRRGKAFPIQKCGSMALQTVFQKDESAHPTEKPVELIRLYIENSTQSGGTVFDPFMGSGTTGVACAKLGRKFIGIELEPKYFDIACKRIEDAYKQPDLFVEPPAKAVQGVML
jgi:DNA modification methylase